MSWRGPNIWPELPEARYRIKPNVRPYPRRVLRVEWEDVDTVAGRITGVTTTRVYKRSEVEPV